MPYLESNAPSTVVDLDGLAQSPPGFTAKKVLMIVKRGDRRELVEVDMGYDQSAIRSRPSRIPRCHTKPFKAFRKKTVVNEHVMRRFAALYDQQSKIPKRPMARGSHQDLYKACQLKPTRLPKQSNNVRPTEVSSSSTQRLDDRMQSLQRRMDRIAGKFRHQSNDLNQRLEKLHQEVDDASVVYPSFFHSFRKQWLVDWGLFVVTHMCMGVVAALRSRKAHGKSKRASTPDILSNQNALLAEMASLLPSEKKEQIMMCSRTLGSTKTQDLPASENNPKLKAKDFGPADELWESTCSPPSSAGDTFDQWRSDDLNNFTQENTPRRAESKRHLEEGRPSGLKTNGYRESPIKQDEAEIDYEWLAEKVKEDIFSPRSEHSSCNSYTENQCAADRSCDQMAGETGEQDAWLEAIKPETTPPAPLSRLEAESGSIPLKLLSVWNDAREPHPPSLKTHQVPASGITRGGKKGESGFDCVLSAIQNPFFNNARADSCSDLDHSLALRMPHSRPNLLYGFEAFEETPQASSPFSQFGLSELKTKWISLNDFV